MRILQVYPGVFAPNRGGGVSTYVKNISERLAKEHEVTVFATNTGDLPEHEWVGNIEVRRFPRLSPGVSYFFSPEMLLEITRAEYDVIHGHNYHALPMHFSVFPKKGKRILSTHYHGVGHSSFRNALMKRLNILGRYVVGRADEIVAVSEYEKRLLVHNLSIPPERIHVIPDGVDKAAFKNYPKKLSQKIQLLYVGRIEYYKGIHHIIEVLPKIKNVDFLIVGKGSHKSNLQKRSTELKLGDRVLFVQDLSYPELIKKFSESDVMILLSRYESYSIVVAEALSAGTPCIVANTSALTEWVDNKTCYGIDLPINHLKLEDLINKVTSFNREYYSAFGSSIDSSNYLTNVKKPIYDWDEVVAQLTELYAK